MSDVVRPKKTESNFICDRWNRVEIPFFGSVALGNMTQWRVMAVRHAQWLHVGVESKGYYMFDSAVHWGYVKEKLNIQFEGDARNIADWINRQLGLDIETQGDYRDSFCGEDE